MPGFNPDNINIHDLTIEEPEKEANPSVVFDPERDISDEQWQEMKTELTDIRNSEYEDKFFPDFLAKVTELKILFPERAGELKDVDESTWETIKEESASMQSERDKGAKTDWDLADLLVQARVLYPEKVKELLNDEVKQSLEKELDRLRKEVDAPGSSYYSKSFMAFAAKLKIIFPETATEINLDDEIIAKSAEEYLVGERDRGAWANFLSGASDFKILFPEHVKKLNLDEVFWEKMTEVVRNTKREEGWQGMDLSTFAQFLKVLAAEEIKITDKGLELIMQKPEEFLETSTPEMPENRKF